MTGVQAKIVLNLFDLENKNYLPCLMLLVAFLHQNNKEAGHSDKIKQSIND